MTNEISYKTVHPNFTLNGFKLNQDDLCRLAYCFIKEGEDFEKPVGEFILDWFDQNDFIEMHTSGSTGIPKLISVPKQAMVNSAIATGKFFDLHPGDKALNCLPTKYVAGKMMFVRSFVLGLELNFVAPSLKPLYNQTTHYDFSAMVPLQVLNSFKDLKWIKKLIVGGAKVNAQIEKELLKLKTQSFETYGMTETVSHVAAKKVGEKYFTIFPDVTIKKDKRGCLTISAPKLSDEKIKTNDLVNIIDEHHFEFLGRIDNVINSGGIKFSPEIIESKLAKHINKRFIISSLKDQQLGEKLILIIEGETEQFDLSIFEILENYEKPKEIYFLSNFIETENGKLKRKAITKEITKVRKN